MPPRRKTAAPASTRPSRPGREPAILFIKLLAAVRQLPVDPVAPQRRSVLNQLVDSVERYIQHNHESSRWFMYSFVRPIVPERVPSRVRDGKDSVLCAKRFPIATSTESSFPYIYILSTCTTCNIAQLLLPRAPCH